MNNRVTAANQKDRNRSPQPSILRDWDDSGNGYLDRPEFAAYCLEVKDAITALGQPCIAEIKRSRDEVPQPQSNGQVNTERWLLLFDGMSIGVAGTFCPKVNTRDPNWKLSATSTKTPNS